MLSLCGVRGLRKGLTVPTRLWAQSAPLSTTADSESVLCTVDADGFATVTLNRPDAFNAFSDSVIARFSEIFDNLNSAKGTALRWEHAETAALPLVPVFVCAWVSVEETVLLCLILYLPHFSVSVAVSFYVFAILAFSLRSAGRVRAVKG